MAIGDGVANIEYTVDEGTSEESTYITDFYGDVNVPCDVGFHTLRIIIPETVEQPNLIPYVTAAGEKFHLTSFTASSESQNPNLNIILYPAILYKITGGPIIDGGSIFNPVDGSPLADVQVIFDGAYVNDVKNISCAARSYMKLVETLDTGYLPPEIPSNDDPSQLVLLRLIGTQPGKLHWCDVSLDGYVDINGDDIFHFEFELPNSLPYTTVFNVDSLGNGAGEPLRLYSGVNSGVSGGPITSHGSVIRGVV